MTRNWSQLGRTSRSPFSAPSEPDSGLDDHVERKVVRSEVTEPGRAVARSATLLWTRQDQVDVVDAWIATRPGSPVTTEPQVGARIDREGTQCPWAGWVCRREDAIERDAVTVAYQRDRSSSCPS
jgi:hypothetical protein